MVYHIPYTAKAAHTLRVLRNKFGAIITIDENENVTIQVQDRHAPKVKRLLSTLI